MSIPPAGDTKRKLGCKYLESEVYLAPKWPKTFRPSRPKSDF